MSVIIPDDILKASQMTEAELRLEIALMLYQQQKISSGKVRAWTGLTVLEFQHELAKRGLYLNYDVDAFQADISTLKANGYLQERSQRGDRAKYAAVLAKVADVEPTPADERSPSE